MRRLMIVISLLGVAACRRDNSPATRETSTDQLVEAEAVWPGVVLAQKGQPLSSGLVDSVRACRLRFYLKAGMTNSEANDAIDAGYQKFITCLRTKGRSNDTSSTL
jgi:hypothetical protein